MEIQEIGNIEKNETKRIRITIQEYNKRIYLDIREYHINEAGVCHPTKKGLTVTSPGCFRDLIKSLNQNQEEIIKELSSPAKRNTHDKQN